MTLTPTRIAKDHPDYAQGFVWEVIIECARFRAKSIKSLRAQLHPCGHRIAGRKVLRDSHWRAA